MLTGRVLSSITKDILDTSTYPRAGQSTRKVSWTTPPRVYHAQATDAKQFTPGLKVRLQQSEMPAREVSSSAYTHATETALSTWKISWKDFAPR